MKKKIILGSIIVVVLLTLVSFSSVVGIQSVKNSFYNMKTNELDFEYCKEYLFETVVEISENADVMRLINNNDNLFYTKSNFRTNPMLTFRLNTNKISVEYLDFIYNIGLRIIDRLGEDKVAEFMEMISIDEPDFADELNAIIMNNEELSERITNLNEMNGKSESPIWFFPIICGILLVLTFITVVLIMAMNVPFAFLARMEFETLMMLYLLIIEPFFYILCIPLFLFAEVFHCIDIPDVP